MALLGLEEVLKFVMFQISTCRHHRSFSTQTTDSDQHYTGIYFFIPEVLVSLHVHTNSLFHYSFWRVICIITSNNARQITVKNCFCRILRFWVDFVSFFSFWNFLLDKKGCERPYNTYHSVVGACMSITNHRIETVIIRLTLAWNSL